MVSDRFKKNGALIIMTIFTLISIWLLIYVYQFERTCQGCVKRGDCLVPGYIPECYDDDCDTQSCEEVYEDCLTSPRKASAFSRPYGYMLDEPNFTLQSGGSNGET